MSGLIAVRGTSQTDSPTVLFVTGNDYTQTIRAAIDRVGGEAIEAGGGIDALKRLDYEPTDLVVLPAELPDVPLEGFFERVDGGGTASPPIVIGSVDAVPGPMIQLPADVSVDDLANRIERAMRDRYLAGEFDRHERLTRTLLRISGSILDTRTRTSVERLVYDELSETGAYELVLVGRYDGVADTIDFVLPIQHTCQVEDVGDLMSDADSSFVSRSIDSGEVRVTHDISPVRHGHRSSSDDAVFASVPLEDGERIHGVAIVASENTDAPDGTERSLLTRIGRLAGIAIGDTLEEDSDTSLCTSRLLQVLDHELRNSLAVASMSIETAQKENPAALDRATSALDTMQSVLESVRDLSEHGGSIDTEPTDVHELVVSVWHEVREPPAELTVAEPVSVDADPMLLERMLSNLLRNAIQHAGPDVSVRVGELPRESGFYVEDDGPGIRTMDRERVFEWGGDDADGGVGLGIVRTIADAHEWSIAVSEGDSGGVRFEVTTDVGSTPRDDLSELFSSEQEGFVYPGESSAE